MIPETEIELTTTEIAPEVSEQIDVEPTVEISEEPTDIKADKDLIESNKESISIKEKDIDIELWAMHYMDKNDLINANQKLYAVNAELKANDTINQRIIWRLESEIEDLRKLAKEQKTKIEDKEGSINITHDKKLIYGYEARLKADPTDLYSQEKLWELLEEAYPWIIKKVNVQTQYNEKPAEIQWRWL